MSDNKAMVGIVIDGKRRKFGVKQQMRLAVEMFIEDEHNDECVMIEIRRQPDNEIEVQVFGRDAKPIFHEVVRRGKDRRRQDAGNPPKLPVSDVPVAEGAR